MRIHHLNCGTFCPFARRLMNGQGSLFEPGRLVCHCLLIETASELILIDTGLGLGDIADPAHRLPGRWWQAINRARLVPEEAAIRQIEALGFIAADVRHIVFTHLDFDHAGGLPDFPQARAHVLNLEHEAALHPVTAIGKQRYRPSQFADHADWALHVAAGERWHGFDAVHALNGDPEILLVPLFGHTRGHCGVAVRTSAGWILHAGDAAFDHREYDAPRRRCPLGLRAYQNVFQYDRRARLHNQQRLRDLAHAANAHVQILCAHDPDLFDACVQRAAPADAPQ